MAVQWFLDGNAHDAALSIVGFASSIIGCLQTASGSLAGVSFGLTNNAALSLMANDGRRGAFVLP